MLVLIKGAPGTGKTTLADRLVAALGLEPVRWEPPAALLQRARELMGGWIDLDAYFARCRHLDMERVMTLLHIERWDELPAPPQWRAGADRREMLAWRSGILAGFYAGRFLPELFQLTCRLIDEAEHTVVEGRILGTSLTDSVLTRKLWLRYQGTPLLRILLQRRPCAGAEDDFSAVVNGTTLRHDQVVAALRRQPGGAVTVSPDIGWTWAGGPVVAPPAAAGPRELLQGRV